MIRIQQQRGGRAGLRHGVRARFVPFVRGMLCVLGALGPPGTGLAQAQPVSPAETLLFETDHLARTRVPVALVYDFRKVSNIEPGFTDTVELDLTRENGRMHARLRFLSGERRRELPDIDDAHGNPVLLGFLEHDIAEMKRLTGGSTTYFRKRIRMALANAGQLGKQTINFQGKSYEGQVVRIQPYLDDPLHARFEAYVHKTYTFVLSEAVPGGVYQLSTSLGTSGSGRTINAAAGVQSSALADGRVAKRPPGDTGRAKSGATSSGTASQGTAGQGKAGQGKASPGTANPAATSQSTTGQGTASEGAASPGTAGSTAQVPGPGGGSIPSIEETLTLVKVADPKR